MKKLLLLCFLGLWGTTTFSQHINVVSTNPVNGAVDVDQDSIVLVFDVPVQFNTDNLYETGFNFSVDPEDSLNYSQVTISEDSMTVTYYVDLADDTDYFGILISAVGKNGETLKTPYTFQFTTAAEAGPYTVEGTLDQSYLENHESFAGMVMTLSSIPFDLGMEDEEENDPSDESGGSEGLSPVFVAAVDTETGAYSIAGVRQGNYFPTAVNVPQIAENDENNNSDEFFPDIFIYDPNENLEPDSISVNPSTTTDYILAGIDMHFLDLSPLLFSEALEIAQIALDDLENDPVIMGGSTYYSYWNDDTPASGDPGDQPNKIKWPSIKISLSSQTPILRDNNQKLKSFSDAPDGTGFTWEIYAYDAVKDSAVGLMVLPFGSMLMGYFSEEDVELDVKFSTIKPLPDNVLDSDQVMAIATANGGSKFMETYHLPEPNGYREIEVDLSALHEYWTYTPDPTPNAPQFWKVSYYTHSYNYETEESNDDSLFIFMDISDGDILFPTSIGTKTEIPSSISLHQNYPNPFNPTTMLSYQLSKNSMVQLEVFDMLGRKVATLVNGRRTHGIHKVEFNAHNLASGIYIYRLNTGEVTQTRKMLLLK